MSYQVLARKWRPGKFAELVGQEHVVAAIANALDNDRLHHAYLFTGTRGVGKTTIARIFSKSLNCEEGQGANPCGVCATCKEIEHGNYVDLLEIDAASRTKVEDTRDLLDNVQYKPTRGRYKVYLIDEVHMLSKHSFNALLKTLEEPPPHVKFLLATTDPQKLPITILSRCLQFNLKALSREQISGQLTHILTQENIPYEDAALGLLARAANGSMRDALSLTDQAIAQGDNQVVKQIVTDMLGLMDRHMLVKLLYAVAQKQPQEVLGIVQQMAEQAPDYGQVLAELSSLLHQIALTQWVPEACKLETTSAKAIYSLAKQMSSEQVQLLYQISLHGRKDMPYAADGKSALEMTLLRMMSFAPAAPVDDPEKLISEGGPDSRLPIQSASTANDSPDVTGRAVNPDAASDNHNELPSMDDESDNAEQTLANEQNAIERQAQAYRTDDVAALSDAKQSLSHETGPETAEAPRAATRQTQLHRSAEDVSSSGAPLSESGDSAQALATEQWVIEQQAQAYRAPDAAQPAPPVPAQQDEYSHAQHHENELSGAAPPFEQIPSQYYDNTPPRDDVASSGPPPSATQSSPDEADKADEGGEATSSMQDMLALRQRLKRNREGEDAEVKKSETQAKGNPLNRLARPDRTPVSAKPEDSSGNTPPMGADVAEHNTSPTPASISPTPSDGDQNNPAIDTPSYAPALSENSDMDDVPPWVTEAVPEGKDNRDYGPVSSHREQDLASSRPAPPVADDTERNVRPLAANSAGGASQGDGGDEPTQRSPILQQMNPDGLQAYLPDGTKLVDANQIDSWSNLISQMPVAGLVKQVALHSAYLKKDKLITLELDDSQAHLLNENTIGQVKAALCSALNETVELEIQVGKPEQTPFSLQQKINAMRQQYAEWVVSNDEHFQTLVTTFNARVNPQSVTAR